MVENLAVFFRSMAASLALVFYRQPFQPARARRRQAVAAALVSDHISFSFTSEESNRRRLLVQHPLVISVLSPKARHPVIATCARSFVAPLVSPDDYWGNWTVLFATAAFGIWSEKTKLGRTLSAAMVSTLMGLAASSVGVLPSDGPVYGVVMEFLLPLVIPLLLFNADMGRIVHSTGFMLLAFLVGSAATIIGTIVAYLLVPMKSLGQDSWKIAAALMASYIGGCMAVNYVAVSEALGLSPSVFAAGIAADNVMCAIYFTCLFALASKIPPEHSSLKNDCLLEVESRSVNKLPVLESAGAIAVSLAICKVAIHITKIFGIQGGNLPCITAIIVALATIFPGQIGRLAPAGESIALILMQVDKRYGRYSEQMTAVVAAFEAVAGEGAARTYSVLASKAMSRHFRCLRDGIVAQLRAMGDNGLTPRLRLLDQSLRQHEAFQHAGMLDVAHPWRPQRGLPGRSVSILRAWLFEHFLHPYPSDVDKLILARQTGLSRGQVSNWFINARVRLWKPMVEEMYLEEMKEEKKSNDQFPCTTIKHGGGSNPYPNDPSSQPHYETHMTSSIVSNVNTHHQNFDVLNTGSNLYDMDELTLGLQRCQGPSSLAREEVGDDHEVMQFSMMQI